jgi:SAM-dependent methyltransferase
MTDIFQQALADIAGGRVLDVATQQGGFVRILAENLRNYAAIVGIDTSYEALVSAQREFNQDPFHFVCMDASQMGMRDVSFDTVSLSASLHHLVDIPSILAEMKRVLRLGGRCIVAEMHRDGQTPAQLTLIYLHHWVADVDSALGSVHNRTLSRQAIIDHVERIGLCDVRLLDSSDTDADPMDEGQIERLDGLIDRSIQRAKATPRYEEFRRRGEELRERLHAVGVEREPVVVAIGEKR